MYFWWFILICDCIIPVTMIIAGRMMLKKMSKENPFYGASDNAMGILSIIISVIQLAFLIGSVPQTEKALKRNFNEDGTKR